MKELEKTLKALANRRRLAIIKYLKENREKSVSEIAEAIHLSFRSTSRHLSILTGANIIEKEQKGLQVFYCLHAQQTKVARTVLASL